MGNASSIFDCAINPLNPLPREDSDGSGDEFEAAGLPYMLEDCVPLRDSLIWKLQANFYQRMGIKAWTDAVVPNFVTSNSFIARAYAKVIMGLIRDVHAAGTLQQPVHIVEVGAGHGKLGYLIVESLLRFRAFMPSLADGSVPFKYIITDISPSALESMRKHTSLRDFIDQGFIDLAVLDLTAATTSPLKLNLMVSGQTIPQGSLAAPLFAIANYTFDSLRQDGFRVRNGVLEQVCVSIASPDGRKVTGEDVNDPAMLAKLQVAWAYKPVDITALPEPYASDQLLRSMLSSYCNAARVRHHGQVMVPLGGLALMRSLLQLSSGRLVMLAGDKGYSYLTELAGARGDPHMAVHGSCSFMVNFHALRQFTAAYGGRCVMTPNAEGFKVAALVFGSPAPAAAATASSTIVPVATSFPVPDSLRSKFVQSMSSSTPSSSSLLAATKVDTYGGMLDAVQQALAEVGARNLPQNSGLVFAPAGWELPPYPVSAFSVAQQQPAASDAYTGAAPSVSDAINSAGPGGFPCDDDEVDADPLRELRSDGSESGYPSTTAAISEVLSVAFNPEDFSTLQRGLKEEVPTSATTPSLRHVLALLRLSNHDAEVFLKFKQVFIEKVASSSCPDNVQRDVRGDLERVYAGYYPLQTTKDVCFELARVCMGLKDYAAAVEFFGKSNELCGQHHVTWHNLGICYYHCGENPSAIQCFKQALALRSDYGESRLWLDKVSGRASAAGVAGAGDGVTTAADGAASVSESDVAIGMPSQATLNDAAADDHGGRYEEADDAVVPSSDEDESDDDGPLDDEDDDEEEHSDLEEGR